MPIQFPTNPTLNQTYSYKNKVFKWDGSRWFDRSKFNNNIPGEYQNYAKYTASSNTTTIDTNTTNFAEVDLVGGQDTEIVFANAAKTQKLMMKLNAVQPVGYSLENAIFDNVTANTVADTTSTGIQFKTDGTKMYILSNNDDNVYQYSLSTAWDLNTASYDGVSLNTTAQDIYPQDLYFQPDGTAIYVIGTENDKVTKYSLPTPWILSGESVVGDAPTQDNFGLSVSFKPDGTKMYIFENGASLITQYALTTPWDLSTVVLEKSNVNIQGNIVFKPDGSKLFLSNGGTITQYSLTTPWEIDTAVSDSITFAITGENFAFSSTGDKLYSISGTTVYQYSTVDVQTSSVTWPANVTWSTGTAVDSASSSLIEFSKYNNTWHANVLIENL